MNTDLLGKMLDAGFTKEEILSLVKPEPMTSQAEAAADDPEPVSAEPAAPAEPEQKAPDPEPGPAADTAAMEKRLDGIESKIADLVKAIQVNNLRNDNIETMPDTVEQNADRALAEIIRPPRRERS